MAEPPQEPARVDFFISYTGVDRTWAEWIAWALEEAGYSTIIQAWDFRPGTNFIQAMDAAARQASRTLAVLSPDYFISIYAEPEWQVAFRQSLTSAESKLLPVRVRECDSEGLLSLISYIDLVGLTAAAAKAVLLAGVPQERAKPEVEPPFPGGQAVAPDGQRPEPRFPGALPSIWNVPHGRNPNFTGRAELLTNLYDSLHAGNATVLRQALRGLGGVGKTLLALEYAYRHAADYSVVWWVPSETSPATAYADLSRELGLPEVEASESEVRVQAVRRWLERHAGWLLVFDNAVEPEAVRPYLPQGGSGHVIITSRFTDWKAVASDLTVEVFERHESVAFLKQRTGQSNDKAADDLAEALGDLPLALAQAADYIGASGATMAEYLDLFETRRAELWEEEEAPVDYPKPVGATWSLAMDQVKQEPGAAELLYLLAYFAPEPVSRDWLVEGAEHLPEPLGSLVQDQLAWNRMGRAFRRYGLVEVTEAGLLVHRLVQAVTRDRLAAEERQVWAVAAVRVVTAGYPTHTYNPQDISIWVRCAKLLSHAQVAVYYTERLSVTLETTTLLLDRIAGYLHSQGRYGEAIPLSQRALEISKQVWNVNHCDVATRLSNLATLYRDQGRYEEAEQYYQQALDISKKTLRANHPIIARRFHNLAALYRDQKRYEEAEPLFQWALQISEQELGLDHLDVAIILNSLAALYRDQERYEEAEPLFQRVLHISERTLEDNHPSIATSLNNLAALYRDQKRYEEAEPLFQRVLRTDERVLGPNHPDTARSLNNLATLYRDQGRYAEAEPLYQRALTIATDALPPDHPLTRHFRSNYDQLLQQRDTPG